MEVSNQEIIGRSQEIEVLVKICQSGKPELLAIYGRRRIGKTFLISQYFKNQGLYLEITGIKDAKTPLQLDTFTTEFSNTFFRGAKQKNPLTWLAAFEMLLKQIKNVATTQKVILFFDELPWLAGQKSGFLAALDYYWNRHFSRMNNIIVIVCGSAAAWMIHKIIGDKGGLHGRITRTIRLLPFNLSETEEFLKHHKVLLNKKQVVELCMAFGGVAKYLTQAEPAKSVAQIINDVCFSNNGYLFAEFNQLYASLFDQAQNHIRIVKELAKKASGLTQNDLLKKAKLKSGGGSSHLIYELEESGFIARLPASGKSKNESIFKLVDEYSLFYLTWMNELPPLGLGKPDPDYWLKKQSSREWSAWSGFSFENICLKHAAQIKQALGIRSVITTETAWSYLPKTKAEKGAQIDLVIDRNDHCINLCEIKFCQTEFVVTKEYAMILEYKKQKFIEATKTKKTVFLTLITPYGAKINEHYNRVVNNQVTLDNLFANLA